MSGALRMNREPLYIGDSGKSNPSRIPPGCASRPFDLSETPAARLGDSDT